MKRFGLLLLVWSGLWSCASFASPKGYYLWWAEVSLVGRAIRVSFNPIDCNVCSFVCILPQEKNGVLVAHFDVSLIASDQLPEAQEGKIVARKAKLFGEGKIRYCPNPPTLVLGKEGGVLRIDFSTNPSFKPSELLLLTADSVDRLSALGLFDKVEVMTRRTLEADPIRVLEPIKAHERKIVANGDRSQDAEHNEAFSSGAVEGNTLLPASYQGKAFDSEDFSTLARVISTNEIRKRKLLEKQTGWS